jgi:hypothetical protein
MDASDDSAVDPVDQASADELDLDVDLDCTQSSGSKRSRSSRARGRARGSGRGRGSGRTQVRKKRKAANSEQTAKANSLLALMGKGVQLQKKAVPSALHTRCWSWKHWIPVDETKHGSEVITSDRFDSLKHTKPKLMCVHCAKPMSWDPSTKRKKHLCLKCPAFARTDEFKDAKVVADREEFLNKWRDGKVRSHVANIATL